MDELKSRFFDFGRFQRKLEYLVAFGSFSADFDHAVSKCGKTLKRDSAASEIYVVGLIRTAGIGQAVGNVGNLVFETGTYYLDESLEDYKQFEKLRVSFNRPVNLRCSFRAIGISEIPKSRVDMEVTCYKGRYTFNRTDIPIRLMNRFRRRVPNFDNKMQLILPDDAIVKPEILEAVYLPQTVFMG